MDTARGRPYRRLLRRTCGASIATIAAASSAQGAPEKAVCAVEQAISCAPYTACERSLPAAINLPSLLKIDRPAGQIVSRRESGEERVSKIGGDAGDEKTHILHGVDQGNPWSMLVDLETGRFTLTSTQRDVAFVAFGLCSASILQ